MKKNIFISFLSVFISINCIPQEKNTLLVTSYTKPVKERLPLVEDRPIKNVIFLIGDGTGLVQLTAGQYNTVGQAGLLHIQTMPVTGIVKTYSADNLITDSASGATAFSCGVKTNNGMIGQLPDGRKCKTVLELVEEKGLSTGLVSTSGVTHATPASYAAHVPSRGMYAEIANQYLSSGIEVILGGGTEYFIPSSESESRREDNRNLINDFKEAGYEYVSTKEELENAGNGKLLGLFSPSGMPSEERNPTLADMSGKAIEILSRDDDGFFLMIEASQIDWGGHDNDIDYVLREVEDFDEAVKVVLDFAKEHGETLVVLTADHETGGMTLNKYNTETSEVEIFWTTGSHTGVPVPLMAYGPHAIKFTGWLENTEVGIKVAELLNVGNFPVIEE